MPAKRRRRRLCSHCCKEILEENVAMALLRADYALHILEVARQYVLSDPDAIDEAFHRAASAYADLGSLQAEAVATLLTLAWPTLTPHARRHRLHAARVTNARDVPDVAEPIL